VPENATEVTAAGIARLAGVGRAAVSNWRRRHADFPQPVGGTETSPSFALPEVERWLRAQGKLAEVPLRERVWQQLSGHPAGAVTALVHTGCALLLVNRSPAAWREITGVSDERMAGVLSLALNDALADRFGPAGNGRAVHTPDRAELLPSVPLLRGAAELAAETGVRETYEFLLGRQLDANPRQYTLTPPGLAELMAELAGAGGPGVHTVLDPAAGTGALLAAAPGPAGLYGQESDPGLAAVTALRLALRTAPADCAVDVRTGDTLRTDAFPGLAADAVLCHPPFNERNWGHDELAYDPRWEYGFPARTESELAWVQHALARLREGGTAVLLMPPAAASRRSGRRIRADLLRRGALRAVIALPAGAAPPYGIPLHLWVLRKPGAEPQRTPELLLVDTAEPAEQTTGGGRDRLDLTALRRTVLDAWHAYEGPGETSQSEQRETSRSEQRATPATEQRDTAPGAASRTVPVIELLDDDVDLAPARHLPSPAATGGPAELAAVRERLTRTLGLATGLTPPPPAVTTPAHRPLTTIGELARAGALQLRHGGTGTGTGPLLTEHDVLAGTAPSGSLPADGTPEEPVLVEAGDVVVPVLGGVTVVRVVDDATAGAALGRNLQLLRPDPGVLDPWFLAGFLRGTTNNRQASSHASTATRLDARRLQLPRLPLAEQQRYGERFRALAAFEDALRLAGRLGGQLVQGLYDGLTDGTVTPE